MMGWQRISAEHEGRQCLGVFSGPLNKDRWVGPIIGIIRDGVLQNHLGAWAGIELVLPFTLPPTPAESERQQGDE
jgi:hypothetical protein